MLVENEANGRKSSHAAGDGLPPTMSIPEAGAHYFGLSRNGSYEAAERGEIPYILVGRLKRVPTQLMERGMADPAVFEEHKAKMALARMRAASKPKRSRAANAAA